MSNVDTNKKAMGKKKTIDEIAAFVIGHEMGMNPHGTIRKLMKRNPFVNMTKLIEGFDAGRKEYVEYNGLIDGKSPKVILSLSTASQFAFDGILNIPIEESRFNDIQLKHVRKWWTSGAEQYNEDWELEVLSMLEIRGVVLL
jgi:hypothetical protein